MKRDVRSSELQSHETTPGIFAEFLQNIVGAGVDLSVHHKRENENGLEMKAMETVFFNPSAAYIREAIQAEEVMSVLRRKNWLMLKRPVYLITGLKIARGASAATKLLKENGANAQVSVNLAAVAGGVPVTTGPKIEYERKRTSR